MIYSNDSTDMGESILTVAVRFNIFKRTQERIIRENRLIAVTLPDAAASGMRRDSGSVRVFRCDAKHIITL